MVRDSGTVTDPDRDKRVSDAERFIDDRRRECLAMMRLWLRSSKPYARDELTHWRAALKEIDLKAARLQLRYEPPDDEADDGADDPGEDQ
jgi:hypothetical protein